MEMFIYARYNFKRIFPIFIAPVQLNQCYNRLLTKLQHLLYNIDKIKEVFFIEKLEF